MKLHTGWVVLAGLLGTAGAADAQIVGPYAAMPPMAPRYGYGPTLLPPLEVYTVVRESGFSPLGIPQRRGHVYTISVIDRGGEDGRLVIDARNGRVLRFMPAYQMGDNLNDALSTSYGPVGPPAATNVRGSPRPPKSIPQVASRTTPVPKPSPLAAKPAPAPEQQSAAVQAKPAEVPPAPPAAPATVGQAKPAPQIAPTQEMPKVMGLD